MNLIRRKPIAAGADQDDDESFINDLALRALGAISSVFLFATLAGAAALVYLKLVGDTRAQEERPALTKRLEVLGGACRYSEVGDGIWWNSKYPHTLDMQDWCGLLGVSSITKRAGSMATGWRLAYTSLGKARVHAVFPMVDAEQALPAFSGADCDRRTMSGCLGRGAGLQSARGISLGYAIENEIEPVVLGLEFGAFVYEGTWSVAIDPEPRGAGSHRVDLHCTGPAGRRRPTSA